MASIARDKNGTRRIQYVAPDGSRPAIRLGKVSQRTAEGIKGRVEQLLEYKMFNRSIDADLAEWIADLKPALAKKLANVGLIPNPEAKVAATLGPFITSYVAGRVDVKPATKEVWRQGETGLIEFFGADKPIGEVSPGDADNYKLHLMGKKLAPMTVRKRLQFATMINPRGDRPSINCAFSWAFRRGTWMRCWRDTTEYRMLPPKWPLAFRRNSYVVVRMSAGRNGRLPPRAR